MAITEVSIESALKGSREALGLPSGVDRLIDEAFLGATLRRTAGILCPCSPATLRAAVLESLQYLDEDADELAKRADEAVEGLIVVGDLLELSQVTVDTLPIKGAWLFAAPPGFVVRPSGSLYLTGIAPDEPTPLPASLRARVVHEGLTRVIRPQGSEDLPATLRDLGLLQLSENAWLKAPKQESAAGLRDTMLGRLMRQPPSGAIDDVVILDPFRTVDYYSGRWIIPRSESGSFVARRPQAYGSPLWAYVMLENGTVTKLLDFPLKGTRWRGCDVAWYLQMAIDYNRGTPQEYRRRRMPDGAYLDFFSPLPLWAQRRLMLFGHPGPRVKCLFSYWIPEIELATEEDFLRTRLWLRRRE